MEGDVKRKEENKAFCQRNFKQKTGARLKYTYLF